MRPTAEEVWKDCMFLREDQMSDFFNAVKKKVFDDSKDMDLIALREKLKMKLEACSKDVVGDDWKVHLSALKEHGRSIYIAGW